MPTKIKASNIYANALSWDANANVVISASTTDAALRITQTGTGDALVVEDGTNPDSTPFVVDKDGRLITGNTSTLANYSAGGANRTPQFQIQGASVSFATQSITNWASGTTPTGASYLILSKSPSNSVGTQSPLTATDQYIGVLQFNGDDGTNFIPSAWIRSATDGTPDTNDMPGRLEFATTADGASSPTERMRIDSSGKVGIGTSSPATLFHVSGSSTTAISRIQSTNNGATSFDGSGAGLEFISNAMNTTSKYTPAIKFGSTDSDFTTTNPKFGASIIASAVQAYSTDTAGGMNLEFWTAPASPGTGNGLVERMRIDSSGNLLVGGTAGRGTTTGTAHLDLFNGTAPVGTLTNGISLYSSSGDFNFMNSAGNGYKVGFRNVPPVGTKTGSYTLATSDVGKYVQVSTGGSITIPDATFAEGDVISIFNNTTGSITITCSITTAYIAGTDSDKATMTLATRGVATVLFISGTVCVVSGNVT